MGQGVCQSGNEHLEPKPPARWPRSPGLMVLPSAQPHPHPSLTSCSCALLPGKPSLRGCLHSPCLFLYIHVDLVFGFVFDVRYLVSQILVQAPWGLVFYLSYFLPILITWKVLHEWEQECSSSFVIWVTLSETSSDRSLPVLAVALAGRQPQWSGTAGCLPACRHCASSHLKWGRSGSWNNHSFVPTSFVTLVK